MPLASGFQHLVSQVQEHSGTGLGPLIQVPDWFQLSDILVCSGIRALCYHNALILLNFFWKSTQLLLNGALPFIHFSSFELGSHLDIPVQMPNLDLFDRKTGNSAVCSGHWELGQQLVLLYKVSGPVAMSTLMLVFTIRVVQMLIGVVIRIIIIMRARGCVWWPSCQCLQGPPRQRDGMQIAEAIAEQMGCEHEQRGNTA